LAIFLNKFFLHYLKNFINKTSLLVCIIFYNLLFFKLVGALTSKPFAYKARSWELSMGYIVDLSNVLAEKIWIDMKALDIMWIIPWVDSFYQEGWISDKTRFSYDGFSLCWVTNFYLKKRLIFIPIYFYQVHARDPLFCKYIIWDWFLAWITMMPSIFDANKTYVFDYFYSLFNFISFYRLYTENYKFTKKKKKFLRKSTEVFFLKGWFRWSFGLLQFNKNQLKKTFTIINNLIYNRMRFFNKEKFSLLWLYNSLSSYSMYKLYFYVLSNLMISKKSFTINLLLDYTTDFLLLSKLKKIYISRMLNKITTKKPLSVYLPINPTKQVLMQKFNILENFQKLFNLNIIFLINVNLWLINPKLHLQLWKNVKQKNLSIFSIGNVDDILFTNINFGNFSFNIFNILTSWNWVPSLIVKQDNVAFIYNQDNLQIIEKLFISYFFFWKNLKLLYIDSIIFKYKNYFLPVLYNYYSSNTSFSNFFSSFTFFYKKFWKIFPFKFNKFNDNSSYYSVGNSTYKYSILFDFFRINFFNIKKGYFFLFESNIYTYEIAKHWDIIFPINLIGEGFFIFKNYFGFLVKSLFLWFCVWLSKNIYVYLNIFLILQKFPFLWGLKNILNFLNLKYFFLYSWLETNFKLNFKQKNFKNIYLLKITKVSLNFTNFIFINIRNIKIVFKAIMRNHWWAELSYLWSSRYCRYGFGVVRKQFLTFSSNLLYI
jgi:hypothetical protein